MIGRGRAGSALGAGGETPAAFDVRGIPARGVAPQSNTPGILGRRALRPGRLAGLDAIRAFHHGLLAREHGHWAAALLVFAVLAVVHTWPLASAPGVLSRNDNGDAQLNEWIVAWVAHQLPRDPARLFQANIFYPAKDALAFSEPLIVPALIAAPALWLGASPVLAMNLLMLAGFALTGLGANAVAWAWTRDRLAGLAAGSLFAFNAHTLTRLAHVQAVHAYGLPLALLLTERLMEQPRIPAALALGACMAMMAYTSGYFAVFASVMIAVIVVAGLFRGWARAAPVAAMLTTAAVTAAALAMPLLLPYRRVAAEQHMVRPIAEVALYSATIGGYFAAPGRIHMATWSAGAFARPVDAFFPGVVALALSAAAVWYAVRGRDRWRAVTLIAIGTIGVLLSLGLKTPLYQWLYTVFPPMHGIRAAARFGSLFLLAVSLLAALGLANLRKAWHYSKPIQLCAIAAMVLLNVEALRAPFGYRRWEGVPRIYEVLAREPGPVVLAEMPFYPAATVFQNAEYVLNSTAHWRPLMNGYSGYVPDSYVEAAAAMSHFPEPRAFPPMNAAGVTHVTVHPNRFGSGAAAIIDELSQRPDFELIGVDDKTGIRLYRYIPANLPPKGGSHEAR
jgi:hypothetical protein